MEIKVLMFGLIAESCNERQLAIENIRNTDELVVHLKRLFPQLSSLKFMISVDRKIIHANTFLNDGSEIALLPPFSGG